MATNNGRDNKGQFPTGSIIRMDFAPGNGSGWLACDGTTKTTTTYPELFAVIGYTYGGSGTSFVLPTVADSIISADRIFAPEPITWTQRTSSFGADNIFGVAYDGTYFVAVGNVGKLATATDPTGTWTQRTSSFGASAVDNVGYYNSVWVISGSAGKLATATDPTGTWTQRTSSFTADKISDVAYGNNYWVAVGDAGKLATAVPGV